MPRQVARSVTVTKVTVDTTAGGTLLPTTAASGRFQIEVFVELGETETVYIGTGTVHATTNYICALTAGQQYIMPAGAGLAIKGLSTGSTVVRVTEWIG